LTFGLPILIIALPMMRLSRAMLLAVVPVFPTAIFFIGCSFKLMATGIQMPEY